MTTPVRTRIWILDDSPLVRDAASEVLEKSGFAVSALETPADPTGLPADGGAELVLIDTTSPRLRPAVLERLRERAQAGAGLLVVFSDGSDGELASRAAACGATGYVKKSDGPTLLVRHVERMLRP